MLGPLESIHSLQKDLLASDKMISNYKLFKPYGQCMPKCKYNKVIVSLALVVYAKTNC